MTRPAAVLLALMLCLGVAQASGRPSEKSTLAEAAWEAYERGEYAAALNGFRRLAKEGVVRAQTNLGYMYATGTGVDIDLVESAYWFRQAAEAGHVGAQVTLGLYYFNGEGVDRDVVAAHAWFTLATAGGHPTADDYQLLAAQTMTPAQLAEAHRLVKKLYSRFGEAKNLW